MWHKAVPMGHTMRIETTQEGLLVSLANHYTNRGTPERNVKLVSTIHMKISFRHCLFIHELLHTHTQKNAVLKGSHIDFSNYDQISARKR